MYHCTWTSSSNGREVPFHQGCDDILSQLRSRNIEDTKRRPSRWCSLNYCEHWSPKRGHETAWEEGWRAGGSAHLWGLERHRQGDPGAAPVGRVVQTAEIVCWGNENREVGPPKQSLGTARMRKMVKNSPWPKPVCQARLKAFCVC